jgi:hypothetical protein
MHVYVQPSSALSGIPFRNIVLPCTCCNEQPPKWPLCSGHMASLVSAQLISYKLESIVHSQVAFEPLQAVQASHALHAMQRPAGRILFLLGVPPLHQTSI